MPTESMTRTSARAMGISHHRCQARLGPVACTLPGCIAGDHFSAEFGELLRDLRRAGMMPRDPAMLGSEAERQGDLEIGERLHLSVEPGERMRSEAVGPGQTGAQMPHADPLQPAHGVIEPMILEVKPLAETQGRRMAGKTLQRALRRTVFAQQTHVEVAIIGGPLCFLVSRGCSQGLGRSERLFQWIRAARPTRSSAVRSTP